MRTFWMCSFILILLSVGCKKEETTEPEITVPAIVVGTWVASSWTFNALATDSTIDLIANGAELTVVLQNSGRYTLIITAPGESPDYETGGLSFSGDQMTITSDNPNEGISVMTWSVTGTTMTLLSTESDYDFDGDNIGDPATMSMILQKQ